MKIPSRETLHRRIFSRDAPVFVQFAKYGAAGVVGTILLLAIVQVLSITAFPAGDHSLVGGEPITDALRQRNLVINNAIAFPFANFATYFLNRWLVFTPGRHTQPVEFAIFTAIAAIGFAAGLFGGPLLIKRYGIPSVAAQLSLVVISACVNYLCRKFLVFAR